MAQVSITQLANGTTADVTPVNSNFNAIATQLNGNLDSTNLAAGAVTLAKLGSDVDATSLGWASLGVAPNTVTALGNRSYSLVFNSVNKTTTVSPGMRLKLTRTAAAPTQCTSLNGTTQYYSKSSPAGMTFTNNFVVSAWVKLASYPAGFTVIASRWNGTSGFRIGVNPSGQVEGNSTNAGAGNAFDVTSYQSLPLNKWVHIAVQTDMTTTSVTGTNNYIMIDGVEVPGLAVRTGTNPTSLVQAGNLEIGSNNAANFFPGKIAQVAIYSAKVTQATILASMHQSLAGTETSLVSAYSFNGVITDLNTTNANNLTANGSAVATNADSPYGGQADGTISSTVDYGIVTKTAFSTNTTVTVQVPEGCTIPTSGGVSAVSYATVKAPYGMPTARGKWAVSTWSAAESSSLPVASTSVWYNFNNHSLNVPIGEWRLGFYVDAEQNNSAGAAVGFNIALGTSTSTGLLNLKVGSLSSSASMTYFAQACQTQDDVSLAAATIYYLNYLVEGGGGTITMNFHGSRSYTRITAELAYL